MAIYQRDREFHKLISEINVDVVPLRFVQDITCILGDGSKVVINEDDFADEAAQGDHIESLLRNLTFYEDLSDLQIRINYARVEANVVIDVNNILKNVGK